MYDILEAKGWTNEKITWIGNSNWQSGAWTILKWLFETKFLKVMVLVASETGHVYTYSTEKFKPLLNSQQGRKLIRTCLSDKSRSGQDEEDINIDEVKVDQLDSDENMDFEHEQGDVDVRYD